MSYAKDYFFQEAEADLPQGTSAIIPINDVDHVVIDPAHVLAIGFIGNAMDGGEDDEVGGEAVLELSFCMILFMQIGIVDIEIGNAGFEAFGEIAV
jgi:hypothetical protein